MRLIIKYAAIPLNSLSTCDGGGEWADHAIKGKIAKCGREKGGPTTVHVGTSLITGPGGYFHAYTYTYSGINPLRQAMNRSTGCYLPIIQARALDS